MSAPRHLILKAMGFRGPSPAFRRLLHFLYHCWSYGLTPAGKLLTASVLLAGSIGSTSIAAPIYHLFCALAALWVVCILTAWWTRPRLALTGDLGGPCTAGEVIHIPFRVINQRQRFARDLALDLSDASGRLEGAPANHLDVLEPGAAGELTLRLHARRRGCYGPLCVKAYSAFPLDLFRSLAATTRNSTLLVYPKFTRLESLDIEMGRKFQPGGIALSSNTGESPEYIGNREYRAGDPIRRIDFKAWARLAKPAVREYQEEYYCRVALVVDTFVPGAAELPPDGNPGLEGAISLCAAIADHLALGEYIIDLFAAGPELYIFRAGRQTAHFENVLEILASIDATRKNPFDTVTPPLADELTNVSTLICILLDWDESRQTLVRSALDSGCAVKAILVRDAPPTLPLEQSELPIAHFRPVDILNGQVEAL